MTNFSERVAAKAVEVKPLKVLLAVLAAPFYAVGWAIGVVWFVLVWLFAAVALGFSEGRRRGGD